LGPAVREVGLARTAATVQPRTSRISTRGDRLALSLGVREVPVGRDARGSPPVLRCPQGPNWTCGWTGLTASQFPSFVYPGSFHIRLHAHRTRFVRLMSCRFPGPYLEAGEPFAAPVRAALVLGTGFLLLCPPCGRGSERAQSRGAMSCMCRCTAGASMHGPESGLHTAAHSRACAHANAAALPCCIPVCTERLSRSKDASVFCSLSCSCCTCVISDTPVCSLSHTESCCPPFEAKLPSLHLLPRSVVLAP